MITYIESAEYRLGFIFYVHNDNSFKAKNGVFLDVKFHRQINLLMSMIRIKLTLENFDIVAVTSKTRFPWINGRTPPIKMNPSFIPTPISEREKR